MLIYHYTRLDAFQKIVSSQEIFATSIRYLNDSSEFVYQYKLLNDVLPEFLASDSPEFEKLSNLLVDDATFRISQGIFVSCFCKKGDLLSQWRGYGAGVRDGVALGFDTDVLEALIRDSYSRPRTDLADPQSPPDFSFDGPTCSLKACIYARKEQLDQKRRVLGAFESLGTEETILKIAAILLGSDAARVKHPSFSEENEWRLIYKPGQDPSTVDYRVGQSTLVPFVRIDLSSVFHRALKKVVIGPTPNESASSSSIEGFLERHGLADTEVVCSEIPYREI
jgi:hypothetical protein